MNAIIQTTATVPASVDQQRRVAAAVAALASNTRRAYGSAWSGWDRWAADRARPVLPATAVDVADYLEARHADGASPTTVRTARAAIAKVHQVMNEADPTADGLCRDVLRRIGREGRDRGRGQVAGIGWAHAEAVLLLSPSCHACDRHYPGGTGRCSRRSLPDRWQPSPSLRRVDFRMNCFEACSAFTHVAACVLAESPKGDPLSSECFSAVRYLLAPLRLLPAGATVAGRGSHPLRHSAFPRRTQTRHLFLRRP